MYLQHFGLNRNPFSLEPDPDFLWLGDNHKEGLAALRYGILENKGFLLMTGDPGTGKTVLIKSLLNLLTDDVVVATIPNPSLTILDFFNLLSYEFEMAPAIRDKADFLVKFKNFVRLVYGAQKRLLIIIDEAQRLSHELLEEMRTLSNIDHRNTKLVNMFFVGQTEFTQILNEPRNRALCQRITVSHRLAPLTMEETAAYIRHRLKVAGTEKALFMPEAVSDVFSFSQGIPRLINILCDRSLVTAYTQDLKVVIPPMIEECARELGMTSSAADSAITSVHKIETPLAVQERRDEHPADTRPHRPKRGWIPAALTVAAAAVLFMTFFLWPDEERAAQQKAEIEVPATGPRLALKADPKDSSTSSRLKTRGSRKIENPAEMKTKTETENVSKRKILTKEDVKTNELKAAAPRDKELLQKTSDAISAERQKADRPSPAEKPPKASVETALQGVEPKQRLFTVFFKPTSAELEGSSYETLRQVFDHLSAHTDSEITISAYPALDARPELSVKMAELRAISLKTVLATQPKFNGKIIVVNPDGPGSDQNRKSTAAEFSKPMVEIRVIRRTATAEQ